MDLRDVVVAVRHRWWWLLGGVLLGLAAAAALAWGATPLYASTTELYVSAVERPDPEAAYEGDLYAQQRSPSYAEALRSRDLAARAIADLDLDLAPAALARSVTVVDLPDTTVLVVTVTDESPTRARDLAAALGQAFTGWVAEVEARTGDGTPKTLVATVQPADTPSRPVSPDLGAALGLGGSLGLLAGLGLTVLRHRSSATVRTEDDVRRLTGAPLIGAIPAGPEARARGADGGPVGTVPEPSLRGLLANLSLLGGASPPRVVVVTGAEPEDEAPLLARYLADALAASGRRVALVRADIRRAESGAGERGDAGLVDVLEGWAELPEVLADRGDGRPLVLSVGSVPADPDRLLGSPQLRTTLTTLGSAGTYVVVDAPSLSSSTDAAVLGASTDGCLLVVRFGSTRAERVAEAAGALARTGAELLGVVLTRVPAGATVFPGTGHRYEADADRGAVVGVRRALWATSDPGQATVAQGGPARV